MFLRSRPELFVIILLGVCLSNVIHLHADNNNNNNNIHADNNAAIYFRRIFTTISGVFGKMYEEKASIFFTSLYSL